MNRKNGTKKLALNQKGPSNANAGTKEHQLGTVVTTTTAVVAVMTVVAAVVPTMSATLTAILAIPVTYLQIKKHCSVKTRMLPDPRDAKSAASAFHLPPLSMYEGKTREYLFIAFPASYIDMSIHIHIHPFVHPLMEAGYTYTHKEECA